VQAYRQLATRVSVLEAKTQHLPDNMGTAAGTSARAVDNSSTQLPSQRVRSGRRHAVVTGTPNEVAQAQAAVATVRDMTRPPSPQGVQRCAPLLVDVQEQEESKPIPEHSDWTPSSAPRGAAADAEAKRLQDLSDRHIKEFVDSLLTDNRFNLRYVPDSVERLIYCNVFRMLIAFVNKSLSVTHIEMIGHKLQLQLIPLPDSASHLPHPPVETRESGKSVESVETKGGADAATVALACDILRTAQLEDALHHQRRAAALSDTAHPATEWPPTPGYHRDSTQPVTAVLEDAPTSADSTARRRTMEATSALTLSPQHSSATSQEQQQQAQQVQQEQQQRTDARQNEALTQAKIEALQSIIGTVPY
jgi:hypothetical protein